MQCETLAYSLEKEQGTVPLKLPAVLQVWISLSSLLWLLAMKSGTAPNTKTITIALTKSINMMCQCQEKNVMRKSVHGARKLTGPLIYHRCAFFRQRANMTSTFGKNFVLSCGHYKVRSNGEEISLDAKQSRHTCIRCSCTYNYAHLGSTQSQTQLLTCAKHYLPQYS